MADNPIALVFEFLFSPLGLLLIGFGVVVFIIYYFFIRNREPEEEFTSKPFTELVIEDLDNLFKVQGIDTTGSLVQGFDFIGDVDKWLRRTGDNKSAFAIDENQRRLVEIAQPKGERFDLYIFRIFIYKFFLLKWLGIGKKYAVVNKSSIVNIDTASKRVLWNISIDTQLERYGNTFVTSQEGVDYINDIAIKRMNESLLTYIANAPDRLIYLEMKHAKAIDRLRQKQEIRTKSFKDIKKAEAIEEGEDDDD